LQEIATLFLFSSFYQEETIVRQIKISATITLL